MRKAVAQLIEVLNRRTESSRFDSQWCHWLNPAGRTMALGAFSL